MVTTGTFTIPLMKKVGYPPEKAAAVEVASSINGQLAPPVMGAAAFIIAEYVNVPYIEVAKAAAIPAFAAYAGLLWITHVEACKLGLRGLSKSELPSFWTTLKEGLHFLIPICMLLYELIIMQHSAEMSVFRAIVVLALIMLGQPVVKAFVHKKSKRKALKEGIKTLLLSLSAGGSNMAGVAMATASAGIIVGCVSLGLGQQITSFVEILSGGNIFLADDPGSSDAAYIGQRKIGVHVLSIDAARGAEGHAGERGGIGFQTSSSAVLLGRKEFEKGETVFPGRHDLGRRGDAGQIVDAGFLPAGQKRRRHARADRKAESESGGLLPCRRRKARCLCPQGCRALRFHPFRHGPGRGRAKG